jgi:hypothetical protein
MTKIINVFKLSVINESLLFGFFLIKNSDIGERIHQFIYIIGEYNHQ